MYALTYAPALIADDLKKYMGRSMHGTGGWTQGEFEMFGSFISSLNSCTF